MKLIIAILFIPLLAFGQILTDTFNFFPVDSVYTQTKAMWIFDTTYHSDFSTGLTVVEDIATTSDLNGLYGWANYDAVVADITGTNPFYSPGKSLTIDGSTEGFYCNTAAKANVNPTTNDFTIDALIKTSDNTNTQYIFASYGNSSTPYYRVYVLGGSLYIVLRDADTNVFAAAALPGTSSMTDGNWHYVAVVFDRTAATATGFVDGKPGTPLSIASITGSINVAGAFFVGAFTGPASVFKGNIAYVGVHIAKKLTAAEQRQRYALADGWTSRSYNVHRDNMAFAQGIFNSDTILHAVPDTTNQPGYQWQLSFDAYGGKAGDAVTIQLGSGTPVTKALTATNASYTVALDTMTTSSDSLYFTASASDTVYIDNLVLTEALIPVAPTTIKRDFWRWPGSFKGFKE